MFQNKPRRFRHRSNGRSHRSHGHTSSRPRTNSFLNGQPRNNFRPTQSAEKLLEKYNDLAKEAISSGDKTLGENYLQHADHFMRIIEDKNRNRDQVKTNVIEKTVVDRTSTADNNKINQEDTIKNKE